MTKTRSMTALMAVVISLVACREYPAAPSQPLIPAGAAALASRHEVEERMIDYSDVYVPFGCAADGTPLELGDGELVKLRGQLYEKYVTRTDANGGYHITLQTMPVGLAGTGEESGEEFRVKEQEHAQYGQTMTGFNGSWRFEIKFTGLETGRVFWLVSKGSYRLNDDGDLVSERDELTTVCKSAR